MKNLLLVVFFSLAVCVYAGPGISYSTDVGGHWSYAASTTGGEGAFSFVQPIGIDGVLGSTTDALVGAAFVYVPDLGISHFSLMSAALGGIYDGDIAPVSAAIAIKDAFGADILTGTLGAGSILTVGTTASFCSTFQVDITITGLSNTIQSDFIDTMAVGDVMDFDLTLQGADIAAMILGNCNQREGSTLSGSMTAMVPEPLTMAILGLGAFLLGWRKI